MNERWWQKEGDELGQAVWNLGTQLKEDQAWRINHAKVMIRVYEGRGSEFRQDWAKDVRDLDEINYNLCRAACDTVVAEIAGRQKPVPKFQTAGADWKTKRRAKKMEKFMVSVFNQPQGSYLNTWEVMEACERDATVTGCGVAKVSSYEGKFCLERQFFHELFVDPVEARYSSPKNLFHVYLMDRDAAMYMFVDDEEIEDLSEPEKQKRREAIIGATRKDDDFNDDSKNTKSEMVSDQIEVVEAWRLKHGEGRPGLHAIAINGCLMFDEEWDRSQFPFVVIRWSPEIMGWGGIGLVEQGLPIHNEVNANAKKLQERFILCGNKRTYYRSGSIVNMDAMMSNEQENLIEVAPGQDYPQEESPKPIADAELVYLNDVFQKFWEVTGVSQMRASARKEPGVTAGVAIRTLNDMQTARFSLPSKGYENAYVGLTNITIEEFRELAQSDEDISIRYNDEIKWKDVELPENQFDISIAPTSSLPNDPAGRMQMTQELYSSGIISMETFKQLLGWPDLEKEMNNQTAQTRWLEKVMDKMLDEEGFYEDPDGHILDKPAALLYVSQCYFEALYDEAPEWAIEKLDSYIRGISHMIEQMQHEIAKQQMKIQQELEAEQALQSGGAQPAPGTGNRPPLAVA